MTVRPERRSRCYLCNAAVAFVDDSGSGGDAPYFVLAGYAASEAAWNKFVPD